MTVNRTWAVIGAIVGAILLGNILVASAQTPGPGDSPTVDWMTQMHESIWTAVADELNMTYDEVVTAVQNGRTLAQIAADRGVSLERLRQVMIEARQAALSDLVERGVITQEQADWMLSHGGGMMGFGPGGCDGSGMLRGWGMMGGRDAMPRGNRPMHPWKVPTTPPTSNG